MDDLASSIEFMIDKEWKYDLLNVGTNSEISILELGNLIKNVIGYQGNIIFDNTKPDGNPRKLLNSELINSLGWNASVSLEKGIELTYKWYLKNLKKTRR